MFEARPTGGAKSLLLTVLGEHVLPAGGEVWTATLVEALALLGIEEKNARQAMARLGAQGVIEACRVGRRTRWRFTDRGQRLLETGAARIYGFGAARAWDGQWLVLSLDVPEGRQQRAQVRRQLEFAGFGFVRPDLAVTPDAVRGDVASAILTELGVDDSLAFVATPATGLPARELVERAWSFDALAAGYRQFLAAFSADEPFTDADAFAALTRLVHEWRRFPSRDPELPADLLPEDWPGFTGKHLFDRRRTEWRGAAQRHFRALEADASV